MSFHLFCQYTLLQLAAVFEKFLDYVIAKNVGHQLQTIGMYFIKNGLFLVAVCRFKLLLDKPRAMLISAEFNHVGVNILVQSQYRYRAESASQSIYKYIPSARSVCLTLNLSEIPPVGHCVNYVQSLLVVQH